MEPSVELFHDMKLRNQTFLRLRCSGHLIYETRIRRGDTPPSRRRGGCARKKKAPFLNRRRRGGCFNNRLCKSFEMVSGGSKQPPRPLHKGCFAAFSLGRVHPSFAKEGYRLARNVSCKYPKFRRRSMTGGFSWIQGIPAVIDRRYRGRMT